MNAWTPPLTQYPNETFNKPGENETPSDVIWARFTVIFGKEMRMDIGNAPLATYRTPGQLIVQFFAPLNTGSIAIKQVVDNFADVFRGWFGPTVTCREVTSKDIGEDANGWYQINATVTFKSDSQH